MKLTDKVNISEKRPFMKTSIFLEYSSKIHMIEIQSRKKETLH